MSTLSVAHASVVRGGRTILRDATLHVDAGDLTAIVGPNGSGKSTLLRVLSGLWKPTLSTSEPQLDGTPLNTIRRREIARRIAFVPQETIIDFSFTAEEIVAMGRHPYRGRFSRETAEDRKAIEAALAQCDVAQLVGRTINTLSGGERQRVLLARSLALQPEFVLLDEPTASLDIEHSLQILDLCRKLSEDGHAIVLASHDLNAVARFAHRVVLLDGGRIVASGSRADVLVPEMLQQVFHVGAEVAFTQVGDPFYVFHNETRTKLE